MPSQDFLQEYIEEVREHLQELESSLLVLEREGNDKEEIAQIFRAAHSIKGASAYMGFEQLAGLTHELESLISDVQIHSRPVTPKGISLLLECVDFMSNALMFLQEQGSEPPTPAVLMQELHQALSGNGVSEPASTTSESDDIPDDAFDFPMLAPDEGWASPVAERTVIDSSSVQLEGMELDEEDQELFNIFINSFKDYFSSIAERLSDANGGALSASDLEHVHDLVGRAVSSSKYMDYPLLVNVLTELEDALVEAQQEGSLDSSRYFDIFADYCNRLQKTLPTLQLDFTALPSTSPNTPQQPIEEEDEELFAIFLDTFQQHFSELHTLVNAARKAPSPQPSLTRAREALARLISSSQYMSYDSIAAILHEWDKALAEASQREDIRDKDLLDTYTKRLQELLPGLKASGMDAAPFLEDSLPEPDRIEQTGEKSNVAIKALSGNENPQNLIETTSDESAIDNALDRIDDKRLAELDDASLDASNTIVTPKDRISVVAEEIASSITLRVDAQKVDQLLNQVGELVVTRSEFIQTVAYFRELLRDLSSQGRLSKPEQRKLRNLGFRLNESTLSLGRIANGLQDSVMRIRMLPISYLFQRFPRIVRDQAMKLGKQVEIVIEGGETEIDKRVLEQMYDPLVQFLRNAIAHGVESPEERRASGKGETGTIRLAAYHEGDYVAIEIEDDGRGIDIAKLKQILRSRPGLSDHEVDHLSDEELLYSIFLPGVSTHGHVDGSAGRGVGLDVVKENVDRMNGSILVESYARQGTRFTIRIPLTVAIIRALLVKGANQIFTIPLASVTEILRYREENTHTIEGFQVISLRGKTIPLMHLTRLLNMPVDGSSRDHKFIVIVMTSFREVGLVVDGLLGEREVVIKSVEDQLQALDGFSGATILGDGTVSLILDVSALLKRMKGSFGRQQLAGAEHRLH